MLSGAARPKKAREFILIKSECNFILYFATKECSMYSAAMECVCLCMYKAREFEIALNSIYAD